ncbi:Uncharacterised protein [Mycobacteroides abscessus subsp. abscessus]|nr:Uncharacterised protein [Mycobacteroides abscessus subsp. abscessus]
MREHAVFPPGHEHHRELQALGGVQGHHGDDTGAGLGQLVRIGDKGYPLQECLKAARRGTDILIVNRHVFPGGLRIGRVRTEFMCDADQFIEVVKTCQLLRIAAVLQFVAISGVVQHRLDHVADIGQRSRIIGTQGDTDLVEHIHEGRNCLLGARVQHRHLARGGVGQRFPESDAIGLGVYRDTGLGPVADTPARGVEDPPQAHRIARVGQHPQVGDDVANFLALVKPHSPNNFVRNTGTDEDLFQRPGIVVGAVEHRDVTIVGIAAIEEPVDLAGDEGRLVVFVVRDIADDQLSLAGIGP